jgi:hypothetical protein
MRNVQVAGNTNYGKKGVSLLRPTDRSQDVAGVKAKPLGITTKTHSTGINTSVSSPKVLRDHDYILQDRACELLPKERVCNCLKKRISANKPISIAYNANRDNTQYNNLQRCASIIHCKVCAKIVTEKRRSELKLATNTWKKSGGFLYFISVTSRHNANTHFKTLKAGQSKAQKHFFSSRKALELFAELGKVGHITSNETTYSPTNGHHPHKHILIFSDKNLSGFELYNLQKKLALHWQHCCELAGIELPDLNHGLDLRDGTYAAEYVSKWGIEEEMTKSQQKSGKNGSYTPWDLLQLSIEDKPLSNGKLPSKLFQEYAIVFKGTRLLSWSRGLKKLLNVLDVSDDDIINETDKQSFIVLDVGELTFALLKKYKVRHLYLEWVLADIKVYGLDNLAKIDYKDNYDKSLVKKNIDILLLKELE